MTGGASHDGGQLTRGASHDGGQLTGGASHDGGQLTGEASHDGGQLTGGASLTFAGGVEQRGLEGDGLQVQQVVLDAHLDGEAGVRVHVGQRQQVSGAHEEVPVEGVHGQT